MDHTYEGPDHTRQHERLFLKIIFFDLLFFFFFKPTKKPVFTFISVILRSPFFFFSS